MKYLQALWQALIAFFSHLKEHKQTADTEQQVKEAEQATRAARDRHDEEVRGATGPAVDQRLDRWMRD